MGVGGDKGGLEASPLVVMQRLEGRSNDLAQVGSLGIDRHAKVILIGMTNR